MSTTSIPQETPEQRRDRKIAEETLQLHHLWELLMPVEVRLRTYVNCGCTDVEWFNSQASELADRMKKACELLDRIQFPWRYENERCEP